MSKKQCPDSPNGQHDFAPDYEYDSSGRTINCQHCGEPEPREIPTFGRICIGDMFNTKAARWVKTSETEAICVMSAVHKLGSIHPFSADADIVLLWSAILRTE